MKNQRFAIALTALLALVSTQSEATTLFTFDDVPGGSVQNDAGDVGVYKGFSFSTNLDWIDVVGSIWPYGSVSGEFAMLNNNFGIGTIVAYDGSDFTFDGLWAKRWETLPNTVGPDLSGTFSGFNDGGLVWSMDADLNGTYQFIGPEAGNIDELRIDFGTGTKDLFLIDNLAITVPTPAAAPMAILALAGGLAMRRRRLA